jgi:hypothetical protein
MFKQTAIGLTCFLLGLVGGMVAISSADEPTLRFEAAVGQTKYRLSDDSNWHYSFGSTYTQKMGLHAGSYQLGVSWWPEKAKYRDTSFGLRLHWVDLGKYVLDNEYPACEPCYFKAKETKSAAPEDKGRFQGQGSSKGLTFGVAAEHKVWKLYPGAEVGMAALYSTFHTGISHEQAVGEGCRRDWACADGLTWTWYVGASLRYERASICIRRYDNVRASNAPENPLWISATSGALRGVYLMYSHPL